MKKYIKMFKGQNAARGKDQNITLHTHSDYSWEEP